VAWETIVVVDFAASRKEGQEDLAEMSIPGYNFKFLPPNNLSVMLIKTDTCTFAIYREKKYAGL
jgi:hypothetical protein